MVGFTDAFGVGVPLSLSPSSWPARSCCSPLRYKEGSSTGTSSSSTGTTTSTDSSEPVEEEDGKGLSFDSLIEMDVVIYSIKKDDDTVDETRQRRPNYCLGALQENGFLAPLSAWTTEPAFGQSLEFLVDEDDRFALVDATAATTGSGDNGTGKAVLQLHYRLDQSELSYGSRQCHRGVGNPHGEESELLYYVDQSVVDKFEIQVVLKPELEILW